MEALSSLTDRVLLRQVASICASPFSPQAVLCLAMLVLGHLRVTRSSELQHYRKGYCMQAWRQGYQEASAVPMSSIETQQLVSYLDQQAASASKKFQRLVFERDILLALFMWERGCNCGMLTLSDFFLAH